MSTLSKEAVETASLKESAGSKPGAPAQAAAGALHSDAVSLEVALKVHGSKVTEVARGVPGQSEPFEEQTSSMIVFPHGGVVRMSTPLNVGQMLILTNLKTRQDAICRVVKVRNYSNSASYVEVEFTHRQPGYWGVYFESDTAEPAVESVSPEAAAAREAPARMPPNSDSGFIHFGSQEQVQPSASSTSAVPPPGKSSQPAPSPMVPTLGDIPLLESKVSPSPAPPRSAGFGVHAAQPGPATSPDVSKSIENLPASNETASTHAAASESVNSRPVFRFAGETLSSRLGGSEISAEENAGESKNWLLIGACAAALCLAAGGGFLLLHHKPASASAPAARTVAAQPPAPVQAEAPPPSSSPVTVTPAAPKPNVAPVAREASPAPVVKATREAPVVKESYANGESPSQPEPEANPPQAAAPKTSVPSVFGTLNAHPVAPTRNVSAAAPNVDAGMAPAAPGNALLGITSPTSPSSLPAPAFNTNVPIPVGGRIKEPELINKVMPQYPPLAREAHTQGDVEVQIVIDKAGNVSQAKALSGPAVLRQAAVDAVRRWKYQPTTLDGQAIPVQMIVKLRFEL